MSSHFLLASGPDISISLLNLGSTDWRLLRVQQLEGAVGG